MMKQNRTLIVMLIKEMQEELIMNALLESVLAKYFEGSVSSLSAALSRITK